MIIKYVQRSHCEATQLEDEWVILDPQLYTLTKINKVGGYCWSLLDEPRTLEKLVDAITEKYEAENPVEIKHDIESFVSDLMNYGLVEHAS